MLMEWSACISYQWLWRKNQIDTIRRIIKRLPLTDTISGNQTRILRDLIQFDLEDHDDKKIKEIIERVLIITSENIHINSFMYEPIVDMSLEELRVLYSQVIYYLKTESN